MLGHGKRSLGKLRHPECQKCSSDSDLEQSRIIRPNQHSQCWSRCWKKHRTIPGHKLHPNFTGRPLGLGFRIYHLSIVFGQQHRLLTWDKISGLSLGYVTIKDLHFGQNGRLLVDAWVPIRGRTMSPRGSVTARVSWLTSSSHENFLQFRSRV